MTGNRPPLSRSNWRLDGPRMGESGFPFLAPLRPLSPARRAQVIEAMPVWRQQVTGPWTPFCRMPKTARLGWRLGHRMGSPRRRETAPFLPSRASGTRITPGFGSSYQAAARPAVDQATAAHSPFLSNGSAPAPAQRGCDRMAKKFVANLAHPAYSRRAMRLRS
jgi:hypothetical protein